MITADVVCLQRTAIRHKGRRRRKAQVLVVKWSTCEWRRAASLICQTIKSNTRKRESRCTRRAYVRRWIKIESTFSLVWQQFVWLCTTKIMRTRKHVTRGRTDHFRSIFLLWPWIVTYNLDLCIWLGQRL